MASLYEAPDLPFERYVIVWVCACSHACLCVRLWVQFMSVCWCALHAFLLREASKPVMACHLAAAPASLPPRPVSEEHRICTPPPPISEPNLCDTFHYHHPLETQQHHIRACASGEHCGMGMMSSSPLGFVLGMCCLQRQY